MKKQPLQPGLISKVIYEIAKQNEDKKTSDFLLHIRKTLRTVLKSKDYTLDASSLLKEIDIHPDTARRILDLLSPTSAYEPLSELFNYKEILFILKKYVKVLCGENVEYLDGQSQTSLENMMMRLLLRNGLKKFLSNERQVKYWNKPVNWDTSVKISNPIIISGNPLYKDRERNYSLDESSLIALGHENEIVSVVLQVLNTGSPYRRLFSIEMLPKQKMDEKKVKILLHNYASKDGYSTRSNVTEIPLHIEDRGKGLVVHSVSERSIIPGKASRWYLYADMNKIGYLKMDSVEKMIEKMQSDVSIPEGERIEKVRQYQTVRKKVINKRQYQMLTVKIKGLLLYSLVESDQEVFNEIIGSISRCNKYDKDDFDPHYDGVVFTNTKDLDQVRRMDFPFLLDYYKFSHVLPPNFAFDVLKRIAEEFQSRLETISPSELKFNATSRFFIEVKHLWGKSISRSRKIENVDDTVFPILSNYHSTVGSYVRRKQRLISALEDQMWGEEISYNRRREKTL